MDRATTSTRLTEIEAKVAGVASRAQAAAAVRAKLAAARGTEREVAATWQLPDVIVAGLFFALCDRYGLRADVASKRARKSVTVHGPPTFLREVFAPLFEQSALVMLEHLAAETDAVIGAAYGLVASGPALKITPPGG